MPAASGGYCISRDGLRYPCEPMALATGLEGFRQHQ
ncbi:hypothetical protein Pla52n_59840 [Stieleria varia]|uniref:Uncharacterized protein n=1 Tax=Stieleria varia TaxID=2528005 RepID=A0A5C6A0H4_9BACT|nr:hypothetical protein Pla52n_59840 [Stieleria varia]